MDTFGQPMKNPMEATEDKAEEDSILDDANLDVYPWGSEESPEAYNQFFWPQISGPRRASHFSQKGRWNPNGGGL